jgi:hypothetical protein
MTFAASSGDFRISTSVWIVPVSGSDGGVGIPLESAIHRLLGNGSPRAMKACATYCGGMRTITKADAASPRKVIQDRRSFLRHIVRKNAA